MVSNRYLNKEYGILLFLHCIYVACSLSVAAPIHMVISGKSRVVRISFFEYSPHELKGIGIGIGITVF